MSYTSSKLGNIYQLSDGKLFEADTPSKLLEIQEIPQRIGQPQEYLINGQTARLVKRQLWTKRITILPGVTGFRLQLLASRLEREAVMFNSFHKVKKLSKKEIAFQAKKESCESYSPSLDVCGIMHNQCCLENCPELKKAKKPRKRKEVLPLPCESQNWLDAYGQKKEHAVCKQTNGACTMLTCPILLSDPEWQAKANAKSTRKPRAKKASASMDDFQISNELEWLSEQGYCDSDLTFYQELMIKGTYQRP